MALRDLIPCNNGSRDLSLHRNVSNLSSRFTER